MDRRVFVPAIAVVTLTLGCASAPSAAQSPSATPPAAPPEIASQFPCPAAVDPINRPNKRERGPLVEIVVDAAGVPDADCVDIAQGVTTVSWIGGPGVKTLVIAFKNVDAKKTPRDPLCSGSECTLGKAKHLVPADLDYTIFVVSEKGKPAMKDPKLIINPPAVAK